jgi:uncharacterized MAPEG superfamily protein
MTPELTILILATLFHIVTLVITVTCADLQIGLRKGMSPRDPERLGKPIVEQVGIRTSRLMRALQNHLESLPLFAIACITIAITDQSTAFTQTCAWAYLGARMVYVPAYVFGWVPWRSIVWMVATGAIVAMLIAALL